MRSFRRNRVHQPKQFAMPAPLYHELDQQCVIITGGASGIGASLVRSFAAQGACVFFCDILKETGEQLASELGSCVTFNLVNLTLEDEVTSWIEGIAKKHPFVKVLINNAAQDSRISLEETTMERWDQLMGINLRAAYLCAQQVAPYMEPGPSSIINFGSVTFQLGEANLSAYVTAKGAIVAMSRSLARELGRHHIRVNTLSPGWVMTEKQLHNYVDETVKKRILADQCIPALIQPEEIAEVALFLASDASKAITGQNIAVNRGWTHL